MLRVRAAPGAWPRGGLLIIVALAVSCARGPATTTLPPPAKPAERPGPWDTTMAFYDPAHFGPERPLESLVREYGLRLRDEKLRNARFLLVKAQRRLELWVGKRMIKAYRVQLGGNPSGPKRRQGDRRTPEGNYFICRTGPSRYSRALWISYPNLEDARRGLETAVIGRREYEAIAAALKRHDCPPQDTKLGGYLLVHGQLPEYTEREARAQRARGERPPEIKLGDIDPSGVREFYDWTEGCAALFNPDIRELYDFVPIGTPIEIVAAGAITVPAKR